MLSHRSRSRPATSPLLTRSGSILRIGHRGASARAPENTLAAFEEAARLGVDAIELDVHLSADGVPIVLHDETVDRTTDGRGAVAALPSSALRSLDAGSWFAPRFRGERIPTLDETLDWARGRVGLNIELKGGFPTLARAVARALRRCRFCDLLIVSSFDARALILARAAMPRVRLGFLASRSTRGLLRLQRSVHLFAFHPHHRIATAERIRSAHRRGLAVHVWPVNHLRLMRRLLRRGADGLMTDDPALFARL